MAAWPRPGAAPAPRAAADLTRAFYAAYQDPTRAVLEGFHPVRHALRFGGTLDLAVTYAPDRLAALVDRLAPEVAASLEAVLQVVDHQRFEHLSRRSLSSPLLAIAGRPADGLPVALAARTKPVVHLERPRNPGNVGAVIRVAAAADVGAVTVSGTLDPWSPVVLRSATGLQYAVPVGRTDLPTDTGRPVVAVAVDGEPLEAAELPADAVLAIGGERFGLSSEVRERAVRTIGIPMRPGVSSLNLATAVSAVLYSWRAATVVRTGSPPW